MQDKPADIASKAAHATSPREWVSNYADYLFNYAISRISDQELAKDLVQETFLAALEKISSFEGRSAEKTWLTAILKHKIIDVYRKRSSGVLNTSNHIQEESVHEFFNSEDGHWKVDHRPMEFSRSADDPLLAKEFRLSLRRCMDKLPNLWLAVFTMKHMDDLETEMICTELNVTPANFWVIIHRCKLNLRSCLQKNWV